MNEKVNFAIDDKFALIQEMFKDLKIEIEQNTKKEITDLLKHMQEINRDSRLNVEIENIVQSSCSKEQKISIPVFYEK